MAADVQKTALNENALTELAGTMASQVGPEQTLIFLSGDLGAGKSTFVRAFLQAAGVQGRIKSPTYTLIEPYAVANRRYYHLDLYRLTAPEELEYLAFRDLLDRHAVLLIEWPEKGGDELPAPDLDVRLTLADAMHRNIQMVARTPQGERLINPI